MHHDIYPTLEDRFIPEPNTGCWLWVGQVDRQGYGRVVIRQRRLIAHRYVWTLLRGPIPRGAALCHRCDTPPCVNPDHLFVGTVADNNADMTRKRRGKYQPGERNGRARLTPSQVIEIRSRSAAGESQIALATAFSVSKSAIYSIVRRVTWSHV